MTEIPIRVVKIGGSLLEFADLCAALDRWLALQPPAHNVLIAGGGSLADCVREADAKFNLGEEKCHWLCVDVMSVTAGIVAALLPGVNVVRDYDALCESMKTSDRAGCVFDVRHFLRTVEPQLPGVQLPANWDVSSDSIAARVAQVLAADELVLLKSATPPDDQVAVIAQSGYVDRFFSRIGKEARVIRCVDLRNSDFSEVAISHDLHLDGRGRPSYRT